MGINETLAELLEDIKSTINIESNDLIPLEGDLLEKLKSIIGITWNSEIIFYNSTNIVMTEVSDFNKLMEYSKKLEAIMKVELVEYNVYIYSVRYTNCKEILAILGRE